MFLRSTSRLIRPSWRSLTPPIAESYQTRLSSHKSHPAPPPPFQTIPHCPPSTCPCASVPQFPDGLGIDTSKPLVGTMAAYAEQLLVCTGQRNWTSRVEDENGGENLVADVKELVGRGGEYADPYHNTPLLASSFPPSPPSPTAQRDVETGSAYLFPSFLYLPAIPRSGEAIEALVKGYLQPVRTHPAHDVLSPIHRDRLRRDERFRDKLPPAREVKEVMVLICGHGGRDARCGLLGPVLEEEFISTLPRFGIEVLTGAVSATNPAATEGETGEGEGMKARVGLISHIGGHKFAGNVIIYLPPSLRLENGDAHHLAGMGIWYGRVEPKNVEGLIKATVKEGKVVEDMFRGGVQKGRGLLHLPLKGRGKT